MCEHVIVRCSHFGFFMQGRSLRVGIFLAVLFVGCVLLSRGLYKAGGRTQTVDVVIYGKDTCPYCRRAKTLLQMHSVQYTYHDLSVDPDKGKEAFAQLKAGEPATIPQVFVGKEYIGGYSALQDLVQTGAIWDKVS